MFEFLLFIVACAAIAFLVAIIQRQIAQKQAMQPKTKLQPIKIEREETRRPAPRQKRRY